MKHEKSSLNGKITSFMSATHHINRYKQKKKELWKTVRSTSFPKPQIKSVSILYLLCHSYPFLIVFLAVILQIHSIRCPGYESFFLAYDEKLCRLLADTSSVKGVEHERDRNRKPRMKSLWHPDTVTLRYILRLAGSSHCLNFEKFADTAPLMTGVGGSVASTWLTRYTTNNQSLVCLAFLQAWATSFSLSVVRCMRRTDH